MSIFGTGFGQPSQQQQQQPQQNAFGQTSSFGSTGFGAFGQNNQPQQPQANPMFGNLTTSTSNPSGTFGTFGSASNTNAFGQPKPTFGAPSGGTGAFGGTQPSTFGSTSGGGGTFGSTGTGGGAFGASASGGGIFGQPAGQQPQQQNAFGGGGGLFGKSTGTGSFGGNALAPSLPTAGSSNPPYQEFQERDSSGNVATMLHYQSISCMPAYRNMSFEELRVQDYQQGRKTGASAFAAPAAFGQPGQQQQQPSTGGLFGQPSTTAGAFGQQQPATGGFGTFGQPQQQQQPGAFGSFGQPQQQQPATGMFGSFGQPQQNQPQPSGSFGAFGQQPQQQSGGFGAFGQQTQQNKPFGAFGQTQPSTTGFSAFGSNTGTSLFGQPQQQPQQQQQQNPSPFGAFGQQTAQPNQQQSLLKPSVFGQPSTGGGGLFGNTGQQQQGTGGGLLGQPAGQQQQGGGLFGQPSGGTGAFGQPAQPAQQTNIFGQPSTTGGGGLFGNTNQQNPQQQQQNQQSGTGLGSLFSKPAGGGIFGSTAAQNQNQGQQPQNPNPSNPLFGGGGGLFGNTQQQGQQGNQNPLFGGGGGGSLFGGKPPAPSSTFSGGSLFGNANQQQQQPSLGGGLFGNAANTQQQQPQQSMFGSVVQQRQQGQPGLTASIDQPIQSSSISLPPLPPLAASLSPAKKKSNVFADVAARSSPRFGLGLGGVGLNYTPPGPGSKLRGFGGSAATQVVKNPFSLPPLGAKSPAKNGSLLSPDAFSGGTNGMLGGARQSVKKLVLEKRVDEEELHRLRGAAATPGTKAREVRFSPALGVASREKEQQPTQSSPPPAPARAPAPPRPASRLNDVSNVSPPHANKDTNLPLDPEEGEYWCLPTVPEMQRLSFGELQAVKDFTVGRVGFGTIQFLQPVDLTAVPSIADIPGKIVTFDHVECILYPDERLRPPVGEGLNVPARIKLDRCWAVDKSTREPIKNEKDPKHQQRLRKMKGHEGAEFVGFDMETGVWEFIVQEF